MVFFSANGLEPVRELEALHPPTFIPQPKGEAVQRARRSLFVLLEGADRPCVGAYGPWAPYRLTESVGDDAFIVAHPGTYAQAVARDYRPKEETRPGPNG